MFRTMRKFIPNWVVNYFWHLPKAMAANVIYGFPARKLKIIGVTGTKGKTSTCYYIHHLLISSGIRAVLISSVGAKFGNKEFDTGLHVTNPDAFELQKLLAEAVKAKYQYVVLEVTSNGLEQFRNWGIRFRAGVMTNIYPDHLDYHKTMFRYVQAKSKLLINSSYTVLNRQDLYFEQLKSICKNRKIAVVSYGDKNSSFQELNVDAAVTTVAGLGIKLKVSRGELILLKIPGRMDLVYDGKFRVYIDFAHTPDSLRAALTQIRKNMLSGKKLIATFGCAGERDHGRRRMGAVAAKLADFFVITAEDPRSENLEEIMEEIADYAKKAGAKENTNFIKIPDRKKAIELAIRMAKNGDVVGLFGKGHEKSMCFGAKETSWDEREAVWAALVI